MGEVKYTIKESDRLADRLFQIGEMIQKGLQAGPVVVVLTRENRTESQNDHIHPVIREIAKYMMEQGAPKRSEEWWRHYFLGKWQKTEILMDPEAYIGKNDYTPTGESFIVMNKINGTSRLTKEQASEFIEWLYSFGNEIGYSGVEDDMLCQRNR